MPAVTIFYPRDLFDFVDKPDFKQVVKRAVAVGMDAVDPATGQMTKFGENPDAFIDLILLPYDPDDADVTAVCLGTIVTYAWHTRLAGMGSKLQSIADCVRGLMFGYPEPKGDWVSFNFLGKEPGCWACA